jgi:tellurite resistance protein
VKALKLFDESELARKDGVMRADLEISVQGLMGFMEPSYLEGKSEAAIHMSRLLFAATIVIADASDGISKEEIEVFEQFFGKREFSDGLDIQKIKDSLGERIKNVVASATQTQCMQVVRDLCLVSKASGSVTVEERNALDKIIMALGLPADFLYRILAQDCDMD